MDWTTENMKWLFELPPPRTVEEGLLNSALDSIFPKVVRVIFYLLPAFFLITMAIMTITLVGTSDFKGEWRLRTESTAHASGTVLDLNIRRSSKGSVSYVYKFEFKPSGDGINVLPIQGVCFSSNQVASVGQSVRIEYIPDDPKISRIEGCKLSSVPLAVLAAMPLIGVITAFFPLGMIRYKRSWLSRLLAFGKLTQAVIEKVKPGPKGSLLVEVRYNVDGAEFKSKTSITGQKGLKDRMLSLCELAQPVKILVDPRSPKSIFLLDQLTRGKE